jgi:antitoxin ParD1/3/4
MEIHLRPEILRLAQESVERGAYASVDEYVEHAVTVLHEQEAWLFENRAEIRAKIEEGIAAAERGELLDPDQVRAAMGRLKREFSER